MLVVNVDSMILPLVIMEGVILPIHHTSCSCNNTFRCELHTQYACSYSRPYMFKCLSL